MSILSRWKRPDKVIIYADRAMHYRWHRVAPNGRIVSDSGQGYSRRHDALFSAVTRNPGCTVEVRNP